MKPAKRFLPDGWMRLTLEDVAEIHDQLREPVNSTERAKRPGSYPYYGATGQVGWIDDYRQEGEYVLLGEDGAPFFDPTKAKAYLVSGKCWVNNHAHVLKARDVLCSNRYLLYALNQIDYRGYANGTTRLKLTQSAMRQLPMNLAPLPEQHRIVAKIEELLSELDKGIENLETARAQLKVYRQALLKHAFEGKLTAEWRAENRDKLETADALLKRIQPERAQRYQQQLADWEAAGKQGSKPKAPKIMLPLTVEELAELPELPEGWGWVRLTSIVTVLSGYAFKSSDFVSAGIPVIKIANVGYSEFIDKDQQFLDETFLEKQKDFVISPNDLLLALTRPITNNRTKVCRYPKSAPLALLNQRVSAMKDTEISHEFLYTYFGTSLFKESIRSKFSETLQPNLSPKDLEACPIPICALAEQVHIFCEIESRLSAVDQLDQIISASLQQAEALRQSILKKAFSGQLVRQDPDDEPASVLLARIKAEKSAQSHSRKVRT